ncbi:type VI secretion system baseplate subunit TssK [Magnetospirillum sp. 64-120]|uniref:type VI secretion system baseplate subunit TssK n=1 Tax=Magnetospirillum sp. 64-120 TaxID=1895778 RepID=UPI000928785C|nr:type VI secretion system baseplate subunit TssK [Magnetospirillum sp. 64-120]OJX81052.1 MAG: hypothetical protein BGO92_08235 [Magnetospirillum sp. 64-120]
MSELNDIPEPVLWYEGMLLAPHHFQQAWQRSEALLGYGLAQTGMFPWGVRRLSLDRAMLAAGSVRILALEGIMPDGLALLHPRDDEPYLELDLTPFKAQLTQGSMAVHVTVPADNPRPEPGEAKRWRSVEGSVVPDSNTGDNQMPVPRMRPVLSLALTEAPTVPPARRFVSMPIARISFRDDAFSLEPFAPPRMDFPSGSELAALTRSVVQRLREKASAIADRIQSGGEMPSGTMADTLRSMVGSLPRLEALLQIGQSHPFQIYLALCDLMGHLSWLGGQPVPPTPPVYQHDDPLPAFAIISEYVLKVMERVREGYRTLRFKHQGDNHFTLMLEAGDLPSSLVVGAKVPPAVAPAETAEWMSKALIGSRSLMQAIGERRIRGAGRLRIESADELGVTPPAGTVLFRVTADPNFIVPGQILEIVGAGNGVEPVEIQLFAAQTSSEPTGAAATRRQ